MINEHVHVSSLFIVPALIAFGIYVVHHKIKPSSSYQDARSRMRKYSVVLFAIWFVGASLFMCLMWSIGNGVARHSCQYTGDTICLQKLQAENTLPVYVLLVVCVALVALMQPLFLYVALLIFHWTYTPYDKSKRKLKNDQKASLI